MKKQSRTFNQKILITQKHLLPKALLDLNLTASALALSHETIKKIIQKSLVHYPTVPFRAKLTYTTPNAQFRIETF